MLGLTHRGTSAYLGLFTSSETTLLEFESGVQIGSQVMANYADATFGSFALAPDGTTYFSRTVWADNAHWVSAHTPELAELWNENLVRDPEVSYLSGVLATDSHWIHWRFRLDPEPEMVWHSSPHSTFSPSSEVTAPFGYITSVASDDQETVWVTGYHYDEIVGRFEGTDFKVTALPYEMVPKYVTVTPGGTAYVACLDRSDQRRVYVVEVDKSGIHQKTFEFLEETSTFFPRAIAVDPDVAVFVSSSSGGYYNPTYEPALADVRVRRFDLTSGEVVSPSLAGSDSESVSQMTVTDDGALYIAGQFGTNHYIRKVF